MAVVAERERPPATVGTHGRDTVPAIDIADPDMTRAARRARAARRREHLAEWQRELESLCHFDPEFIYDPTHEYDQEATTDPDYDVDGVHFLEFDADGVCESPWKNGRGKSRSAGPTRPPTCLPVRVRRGTTRGWSVSAPRPSSTPTRPPAKATRSGKAWRPDMLVRAVMSAAERERFMPEGILRLDLGAPVPPLVLEVVSTGSAERDLNYKKHLYAAAGISEYLVYDLGGKRWPGSPRALLMYRLEGESYRQASIADEYRSAVFNTRVRIMPDAREHSEAQRGVPEEDRSPPRFQWWDPNTERWRDRESDLKLAGIQEGRVANPHSGFGCVPAQT